MFRQIARIAVLVLAAGLACSLLVRYAPGTMVDERELDRRLSEESIRELRAEKAQSSGVFNNLGHYLRGLTRGDLCALAASLPGVRPVQLREADVDVSQDLSRNRAPLAGDGYRHDASLCRRKGA